MTTFLILTAILLVSAVVTELRLLRRDTPRSKPASHHDWSSGGPPSGPYALRT
jgi:hypothetical protein